MTGHDSKKKKKTTTRSCTRGIAMRRILTRAFPVEVQRQVGNRVITNLDVTILDESIQPPRVVHVLTLPSPTATMSDVSSALPRLVDYVLSFPR